MAARDIIAIGASAGGFEAIQHLVASFPPDLPAAVFVTIHISEKSDEILPRIIRKASILEAHHPTDGERIERGVIYVAPPDHHLRFASGHIELSHGPRENMQRPCINAMFRSAAAAYGERVVGVLLTGLLDDGAAGLWEIQQKNGTAVVQDPAEATFRSMPDSAIRGLNVQYIVRLAEMAPLLTKLAMVEPSQPARLDPQSCHVENATQTCPECGGAMSSVRMGNLREYRCHIGHRIGLRTMIEQKSKNIERMLESARAQSEELSGLLRTAREDLGDQDQKALSEELERRKTQQDTLRAMVDSTDKLLTLEFHD
jgi:two-component system, chemotaxis family, protein-glutamate methylesterase/glutaminase